MVQRNRKNGLPDASPALPAPVAASDKERAAIQSLKARRMASAPVAQLTVSRKGGANNITVDHADPAIGCAVLMNALGVRDCVVSETLLSQMANLAGKGQTLTSADLNAVAALVQGIGPKDEIEAMLAVQMVAIHNATITAARRLAHVQIIEQQDSASGMLNKLARTFATQVEALKKHRSSGEQSIRVQHVTVQEGGQAIVGAVTTGGGGRHKTALQPQGRTADCERITPLHGDGKALPAALQSPRSEGLDSLPMPRRERRSA